MPFNFRGREDLLKAIEVLKEFDAVNPDERICEALSLQWCCNLGFVICGHCGHQQMTTGKIKRMYLCQNCSKEIWVTAGTFFDHVRKFRPYLATIFLYENGLLLSVSSLSKVLGISLSMAALISKKIAMLVSETLHSSKRDVPSSALSSIVCRRTIETPPRQHPVAEEVEVQRNLSLLEEKPQKKNPGPPKLSFIESQVLELLSETPISFSDICDRLSIDCPTASSTMVFLELKELAACVPGDKYIRSIKSKQDARHIPRTSKNSNRHSLVTNRFIKFVEERYQGVGRKYLQLYVALFWIYIDRKRWGTGTILNLCARSKHVPYRKILNFITAAEVKFPNQKAA